MAVKLFLVRHGQSQWNLENRFTGWKNVDLSEQGIVEAQQAGDQLKHETIHIAYTSDLLRAQHTLDIILNQYANPDMKVIKNRALNERSYGDLEGLNKTQTAEKFGHEQVQLWRRSFDIAPPNGESLKDTYQRVIPYFENTIMPHILQQQNVLVVAHGNSLRSLIMYIEKMSPDQILTVEIATGQPQIYTFENNTFIKKSNK